MLHHWKFNMKVSILLSTGLFCLIQVAAVDQTHNEITDEYFEKQWQSRLSNSNIESERPKPKTVISKDSVEETSSEATTKVPNSKDNSELKDTLSALNEIGLLEANIEKPKGNSLRGWLFNTFDEITTTPQPNSKSTGCSDSPAVIVNKSVSCDSTTLRKVTLSESQLMQLMSDEGGTYSKDYMAPNEVIAQQDFKNLISMAEDYQDVNFKPHPHDWIWDYNETKAKLLEQLEISHMQLVTEAFNKAQSATYTEEDTPNTRQDISSTGQAAHKTVSAHSWQKWLNQSTHDFDKWYSKIVKPGSLLSRILPAKYVYPYKRRYRREVDGTTTTMEYCQNRGSETSDGYLHMCTMCAHTTVLPDDRFPRILNEALCHSVDSGCLFVGNTPHGSCRQNVFYMNMLRKKPGSCMMVINDGNEVLTDEWEVYSQPIRVSCECLVNKRSPVAQNVNPN